MTALRYKTYAIYARNHLLVFRDMETQEKIAYKDQYSDMDLNIAYGFTKTLALSLLTNTITFQKSDPDQGVDISLSWNTDLSASTEMEF